MTRHFLSLAIAASLATGALFAAPMQAQAQSAATAIAGGAAVIAAPVASTRVTANERKVRFMAWVP